MTKKKTTKKKTTHKNPERRRVTLSAKREKYYDQRDAIRLEREAAELVAVRAQAVAWAAIADLCHTYRKTLR